MLFIFHPEIYEIQIIKIGFTIKSLNHIHQIKFQSIALWALVLLGMLDTMVSNILHIIKIWRCYVFGVCLVGPQEGHECPCGFQGMGAQKLEILSDEKDDGETKEEKMKEGDIEDPEMEEVVMDVGVLKEVVMDERVPEEVMIEEGVVQMQDSMEAEMKEGYYLVEEKKGEQAGAELCQAQIKLG